MLRMLTVPMSCCPCDVVPEMPFPDCVNVKRNGPCCPVVPAVVRSMFQLPEMFTDGDVLTMACHVPDWLLVFVYVPDREKPSLLIVPMQLFVAPSLPTREKEISRSLTLPVRTWPRDVVPVRLLLLESVCVKVKVSVPALRRYPLLHDR